MGIISLESEVTSKHYTVFACFLLNVIVLLYFFYRSFDNNQYPLCRSRDN